MGSHISILIAEDNPLIQEIYRHEIGDAETDMRVCGNGSDAVGEYNERPADLVILDVGLPDMTGLEVCREIRRTPSSFATTIIIVSSCQSQDNIIDGYAAGADDYLIKPVKPSVLRAKIRVALDRKKSIVENTVIRIFPGTTFAGRYEIVERIGAGAFGSVYRATDIAVDPHREIALKVFDLLNSDSNDPVFNKQFLREAYSLSRMNHKGVVKLFDFGRTPFCFLAMEFIEGESLDDRVRRNGPAKEEESIVIAYEMAKILQYLECRKFVHRDIKPVNIIVGNDGLLTLLDFGLARSQGEGTVSGDDTFRGTPQYAAPECIFGDDEIDGASDIFSLGATLFFAVVGDAPFSGISQIDVIKNRILNEQKEPGKELDSRVSAGFANVIRSMLRPQKVDRPTAGEVIAELKAL